MQTIQQTAKVFKLGMLLGAAAAIAGAVGFMVTAMGDNTESAAPLAWGVVGLAGLAVFVAFRVLAWWFHG